MAVQPDCVSGTTETPATSRSTPGPLKFESPDVLRAALRARIEQYFATSGRQPRDCAAMYAKSAIIFATCAAAYVLLVFVVSAWWLALPLTLLLGLSMAAVGFNIQHDGGHRAYSDHPWINKLAALTLDLLGGSSYVWSRKHNTVHHTFTNVTGHDDDINVGLLGRLSPHQPRLVFHRLQHYYLWILYGFLPIKWHLYDDFHNLITGRIGGHVFPRPAGWDLVTFFGGKALFFTLAFGIPMLLHPWWAVLAAYATACFVEGVVLSVVFQLAHCVEGAGFPMPCADGERIDSGWARHQVETTVDFAPRSRLLTWLVGGLNYQIEHHLFPRICHIHYPALAPLVKQVCGEHGVTYLSHDTFFAGVRSHFRWLRRMGRAEGSQGDAPTGGLLTPAMPA